MGQIQALADTYKDRTEETRYKQRRMKVEIRQCHIDTLLSSNPTSSINFPIYILQKKMTPYTIFLYDFADDN